MNAVADTVPSSAGADGQPVGGNVCSVKTIHGHTMIVKKKDSHGVMLTTVIPSRKKAGTIHIPPQIMWKRLSHSLVKFFSKVGLEEYHRERLHHQLSVGIARID